ncbi:39S ribosomal protein L44, mitochondrial-like [Uloborus diversus]|uniref:39S ribosomal protein L44, mitochondrial-like n=1 Tax=Uloborus diversus TaxID=327109 RepID=UPI00240A723C|nr:39S ribosomal protein L44, mitochondrial-like [Uloborus diversus]
MALCRLSCFVSHAVTPLSRTFKTNKIVCSLVQTKLANQERTFRKSYGRILRVMKARRKVAGPERIRRRSEWYNWNYHAEIYAFNKRLHENMSEDTLKQAFVHDSYLESEKQKRTELGLQDVSLDLKSNSGLVSLGHDTMRNFIFRYLRRCFEKVPEEGIEALHEYLMSEEVLSHVSYNLGTSELIFCAEYPPEKKTLVSTLKAIIGAIATDDSVPRAENFVLDFVCPQLVGKDIFEIWDIEDPVMVLNSILTRHGHKLCEPRLIFEAGRNTLEAIYHVGLYCDQVFLGRGTGETLTFAQEMAAYDVLRRLFDLEESRKPIPFGESARKLNFSNTKVHASLCEWFTEELKRDLLSVA